METSEEKVRSEIFHLVSEAAKRIKPFALSYSNRCSIDSLQAIELLNETTKNVIVSLIQKKEYPLKNIDGYLFKSFCNLTKKHLKRVRKEEQFGNEDFYELHSTQAQMEMALLLQELFLHSTTEEKELLKFLTLGFDHKEIAERLGTTNENVRVKVYRLRKKLLKLIE
jgi:RNA polymerase sigma factor (sigma-70 family)